MAKTTTHGISLLASLSAPAADVWRAWTVPKYMGWYGSDPDGTVIEAHADARKGGRFEVTFQQSDGTRYTCLGTYLAVEPLRRLEFTWTWAGREDHTERVRVTFAEADGVTNLILEHLDIDPDTSHNYAEGWRTTFGKLQRQLQG